MRKIQYNDMDMYTCPNGCDESELELGRDQSSFMAIVGKPYMYIRCGACGFGENIREAGNAKLEMSDVVAEWNSECENSKCSLECIDDD